MHLLLLFYVLHCYSANYQSIRHFALVSLFRPGGQCILQPLVQCWHLSGDPGEKIQLKGEEPQAFWFPNSLSRSAALKASWLALAGAFCLISQCQHCLLCCTFLFLFAFPSRKAKAGWCPNGVPDSPSVPGWCLLQWWVMLRDEGSFPPPHARGTGALLLFCLPCRMEDGFPSAIGDLASCRCRGGAMTWPSLWYAAVCIPGSSVLQIASLLPGDGSACWDGGTGSKEQCVSLPAAVAAAGWCPAWHW